jgi:hypothetical protein
MISARPARISWSVTFLTPWVIDLRGAVRVP